MSTKMWEVNVDHARRCVIDDKKLYLYSPPSLNRDGVVFNVVGQVIGLLSNRKYVVADNLSEIQRVSFTVTQKLLSYLVHLLLAPTRATNKTPFKKYKLISVYSSNCPFIYLILHIM